MNYIETEKERIIESLADTGFASSHIYHLLTDKELRWFEQCQKYYTEFYSDPQVINRISLLEAGTPIQDRGKVFELTHADYLKGPLTLETGAFMRLYTADIFLDLACGYLGTEPVLRNIAAWIHAYTPQNLRDRSQRWHRDTEDNRILKIWMYYSDVTPQKGALEYVQNSRWGDKNNYIWPNYDKDGDCWPGAGYLDAAAAARIPDEDVIMAPGEVGTIVFGDTNGFHRGGLLQTLGTRFKTQCCYLRPNAYQIRNGPLQTFDHNPTTGNLCDKNHPLYDKLSTRAKKALE
ncbi:MAG TPA: hypothetical protein EYN67_06295 [Flavobacteriales bacterium]|nr:hypothetical protein [Flavobacteriales bacterium]